MSASSSCESPRTERSARKRNASLARADIGDAGVEATRQINFLREFDELLGDARLLRSFSMTPDGSKVRIPKIFADAAKLRAQLLQMWLSAIPVLYSAERMEKFYKSIIDAVSRCEPEVGRQITAQLKSLTEHAGFLVEH